jgi:hypothetical protein
LLSADEWDLLRRSNAIILNIDYPLGMAAYHIFSQISTAVGRIMGVYILGKAATLNGRVGDVMIPNVVYDEHSQQHVSLPQLVSGARCERRCSTSAPSSTTRRR